MSLRNPLTTKSVAFSHHICLMYPLSLLTKPMLLEVIWKNRAGRAARWCNPSAACCLSQTMHLPLPCISCLSLGAGAVCTVGISSRLPVLHYSLSLLFCFFVCLFVFLLSAWLYEIPSEVAVCWLRMACHQFRLCSVCWLPVPSCCYLGSLEPSRGLFKAFGFTWESPAFPILPSVSSHVWSLPRIVRGYEPFHIAGRSGCACWLLWRFCKEAVGFLAPCDFKSRPFSFWKTYFT